MWCPVFILEPKEEEMEPNITAGFKERQHKHLSESFPIVSLPANRTCPKDPHEVLISNAPLAPMPPSNVAGSDQALVMSSSVGKDARPVQEMTSIGHNPSDDYNDKDAPISSHTLS